VKQPRAVIATWHYPSDSLSRWQREFLFANNCQLLRLSVLLVANQLQIAKIDENARTLSDREDQIATMDSIQKQNGSPSDAEKPERGGNDALLLLLAAKPLHDEPAGEKELSHQTEADPHLFARHVLHPCVR